MKIVVLGAGQVGATIVEALHDDHEVTVIDLDAARLQALSYRYDIEDGGEERRRAAAKKTPGSTKRRSRSHAPRATRSTSWPRPS